LQLQLRSADVHELLWHAIEIVRPEIDNRDLKVAVALEASSHTLRVDAQRLQQVFWNVLRNACEFTPEHGAISVLIHPIPIRFASRSATAALELPPSLSARSSIPLSKLTRAAKASVSGLTLAKVIVEMHGGVISARSDGPGKGATFGITLPLVSDSAHASAS